MRFRCVQHSSSQVSPPLACLQRPCLGSLVAVLPRLSDGLCVAGALVVGVLVLCVFLCVQGSRSAVLGVLLSRGRQNLRTLRGHRFVCVLAQCRVTQSAGQSLQAASTTRKLNKAKSFVRDTSVGILGTDSPTHRLTDRADRRRVVRSARDQTVSVVCRSSSPMLHQLEAGQARHFRVPRASVLLCWAHSQTNSQTRSQRDAARETHV